MRAPAMEMDASLDQHVRHVDEDRWLASRFAPPAVRARLSALYAFNYEVARTAEVVHDAAVGHVRLAWWREAAAEVHAGAPARNHPALAAYAAAHLETPFTRGIVDALIDARAMDLEAAPFAAWADLDAYVDAVAGGLMQLAVEACGEQAAPAPMLQRAAARAWGLLGMVRAEAYWRERGRLILPRAGGTLDALRERAHSAYAELRNLPKPPAVAFPALGYVALVPLWLRGEPSLLARQMRLVGAAFRGRL